MVFFSQSQIFKEIAEDSYHKMKQFMEEYRNGNVIRLDPEHKSLKHGCIVVVFTAAWIESMAYKQFMARHGNEKYREYDRKGIDDKLSYLGLNDEDLIPQIKQLKKDRIEIIHEKAPFYYDTNDGRGGQTELKSYINKNGEEEQKEIKGIQNCAENAYQIIKKLSSFFDEIKQKEKPCTTD